MKYVINTQEHPVYLQIYRMIRDDIISGVYPYNTKLPSKRLLADELSVSTVTTEHAYALLCDEGYAQPRERSGFFVIFRKSDGFASAASDRDGVCRYVRTPASYPDFSLSVLSKTVRKVLSDYHDVLLEKSPNPGCPELREAIRKYLLRNRGINVESERIIIGSGAEYLYGLIIDLLGRDKAYAIESPCYDKIEKIYRAHGVRYEGLSLAEDGIDSVSLSRCNADVLHTTPYQSFPSGITASASKRHEYIRWSQKSERYIIESDYGSEFSVSSQPMETLFALSDSDNVIYLNTFSKTISSSMRIGYMVIPKKLVKPFADRIGFYSCTVSTLEQYIIAELINSGDFERHINKVRRQARRNLEGI
ncbi:MAG: PLP-dependent aminotransferase family protein [Eubacteriales bacterium]|nr:PLP-dependent aminotransferase family protein [Eubacteriales bacterium]